MTPLVRWVLLATLFGHAMSVPVRTQAYEDACVALCRAENAAAAVAANEDKVHVIPRHQYVEDRRGREADRLLGLCLKRPQHSTTCRYLVKSLREYRGCDCELIGWSKLIQPTYVFSSLMDDLIEDYFKISESVQSQLQENKENVYGSESMADRVEKGAKEGSMILKKASKDTIASFVMDTDRHHDSRFAPVAGSMFDGDNDQSNGSSDVNWDLWCMAQCENGHGGSACDCDVLP